MKRNRSGFTRMLGVLYKAISDVIVPVSAGDKETYSADGVNFKVSYVPAATFPTGSDDSVDQKVEQSFWIGETEVTYELWYAVKQWATDADRGENRYTFQNAGMEGSVTGGGSYPIYANVGQPPTVAKKEPVTMVSWCDTLVWCNALSEMTGKTPVYRTCGGDVIRSSADANASEIYGVVAAANNGFRLPLESEWELAARWKTDSSSTNGSILNNRRYWTPGNYASGATGDYNNAAATQLAALYNVSKTHTVGSKPSAGNHLGLYDMSGNVWEWCWDIYAGSFRVVRGGAWFNSADYVTVAYRYGNIQTNTNTNIGFRVACNKE